MREIKDLFKTLDKYYKTSTQNVQLVRTDLNIKRNILIHDIPKTISLDKKSILYTYTKHLNKNVTYSVIIAILLEDLHSEISYNE